jgi:hypothetical protein
VGIGLEPTNLVLDKYESRFPNEHLGDDIPPPPPFGIVLEDFVDYYLPLSLMY